VVDLPTVWSASLRPSFRNFLRAPCATIFSAGVGVAGAIATFRFGSEREPDAGAARAALAPLLECSGITGLHLGRIDTDATFPVQNATPPAHGVQSVLLAEGLERAALEAAAPRVAEALRRALAADEPIAWEPYDLAFVIDRSGLASPTAARQPPRPDLHARWT
jgi:hypothetical protein